MINRLRKSIDVTNRFFMIDLLRPLESAEAVRAVTELEIVVMQVYQVQDTE